MTTKKPVKKAVKKEASYTATLSLFGQKYVATGDSIAAAIGSLAVVRPPKARGILTLTKGDTSKDRILNPFVIQRLFAMSPTTRDMQLKQVAMLFDV